MINFLMCKLPRGFAFGKIVSRGLIFFLGIALNIFLNFSFGIEFISSSVGFPKTSTINSIWFLAKLSLFNFIYYRFLLRKVFFSVIQPKHTQQTTCQLKVMRLFLFYQRNHILLQKGAVLVLYTILWRHNQSFQEIFA
jgi:hypothetical protein